MTWASALIAGAISVSVAIPRLHNHGLPGMQWLALCLRANLAAPAPIVPRKERGPFLSSPRGSIRNSLATNSDANWRKST
jgi:hypothetical protein